MIKIDKLSKKYDKDYVLKDLSCNIKDNSIYGLVGANGSGKSTLLRTIMGIYEADGGVISVDGEEVYDNEIMKQKMVFVQDDLFFYPGYTLMDTAKWYEAMYKDFDMNYLKELAGLLNLKLDKKISTFSKGMKRQCALICAISTNCDYMFFDETFDGLDPVIRNTMKKILIKQMNKKRTTIVMTSHNLRELEDICDNLGLLYQGGILFESDIDTIKTNMFKVQISFEKNFDKEDFEDFDILSFKKQGSVATIIIKDNDGKSKKKLEKMKPLILDYLPLTLEEVFIYEMEALGYEFNIARNPDDPDTFHEPNGKSVSGFNMVHTISLYELCSKRYLDLEVQPGRLKNEFQAICNLMDRYAYGGPPFSLLTGDFPVTTFLPMQSKIMLIF